MTVKITADIPGYLSVADLPTAAERILIVGTGAFEFIPFADQTMWDVGSGPGLHQPQLYFYPPSTAQAAGRRRARAMMVQLQRETGDPTADDSIHYPVDWPFSYFPYLGPPAIDFVQEGGQRGFRLKLVTNDVILLGSHIAKSISVTDLIAGRLPFRK